MKKTKVIPYKRLPTSPFRAIRDLVIICLVLDRCHAPAWAFASVITMFVILFLVLCVMMTVVEKTVDVVFRETHPPGIEDAE